MKYLTSSQFGHACEQAVCAELSFAGFFAYQAPKNEPDYDVIVRMRRTLCTCPATIEQKRRDENAATDASKTRKKADARTCEECHCHALGGTPIGR